MIRFIFGDQGCGKTYEITKMLKADAEAGRVSLLIVPEQEAVSAERMTLEVLPPRAQLTLEVLNFSRLYNRVCREYGGLCYSYITKPMKHVIMWRTLRDTAPLLKVYASNALSDPAFVSTMLSAVSEMKRSCITPEQLEEASEYCRDSMPELSAKLNDLAIICGAYDMLVSEGYSDSSDDLSQLCDILDRHNFFKGKCVYIDSFTSFTGVEHRVIERIFRNADNVTVTIPLKSPNYSDISTASIEQSLKILKKNADKWGGHEDIILSAERKAYAPALTYLAENIWRIDKIGDTDKKPLSDGSIVMEVCDNAYSEAEAAALHIHKLLTAGARCRDIAVVMRDATRYSGIIEPAFERLGIPFFFSEKSELCMLAPVKFILTAIRIRQYGWQKSDVIAHIKTGLCDFDTRSADIFEEYVNTWNIRGARFTGDDWSMNPNGFTERITERGQLVLCCANSVRRKLCEALEGFFVLLDASENIADMCRAIYSFTEKANLRDKTRELAEKELSFGNKKAAAELASSYDVILKALADLGEALPQMCVTVDDFYSIVKSVFEQTDIGTIPTSIDEVTVGSASIFRSSRPDYVFVLGLCEGEFPASTDDTGILVSRERDILKNDFGIDFGGTEDTRASDELMYIKNTFSAPRKRLYLFTSTADMKGGNRTPSLPFRRTEKLFSDVIPHRFCGNDIAYLCGTPQSTAAHIRNITSEADKQAAVLAVSEYLPSVTGLSEASASTDICRVAPDTVKALIGDKIYISPSSLERYVKCPFSYYASYMLSLREPPKGTFGANSVGDFVHYVMEHIVRFAVPDSIDAPMPTDDEIYKKLEETVEAYIKLIAPDDTLQTPRMKHLYQKLRRLSMLIAQNVINEFSDTDFRPAFFELRIDGRNGNPAPLDIPLNNGARLILKGRIDRVDIWKNEGKLYVRIVDYKTGSKQFDIADLDVGLNTQMLLYLFAICRSSVASLAKSDGASDVIPAGMVYLSSAFPKIKLNDFESTDEQIIDIAMHEISRSGIILDDENVINATSRSHSSELLMGIAKKDGVYVGKPLISSERFENLFSDVKETLMQIGMNIYGGIADCSPLQKEDPCRYCKIYPMCRKNM